MTQTQIRDEWHEFNILFQSDPGKSILIDAAKNMKDQGNREVALRHFGFMSRQEREAIKARWKAIDATTDAECRAHCQFAGLPSL